MAMSDKVGEVRGEVLDARMEGTNGGWVARESIVPAPARSEIRIVSSNRIARVPTASAAQPLEGSEEVTSASIAAGSLDDEARVPTLHELAAMEGDWKDVGFFNVRFQRRSDGSAQRIVVRQLVRPRPDESAEPVRWEGTEIEAAAAWMRQHVAPGDAVGVVAAAPAPRAAQCAIDVQDVYAFQDLEAIDPQSLSVDSGSSAAALSSTAPLTLSVALVLSGADAAAVARQDKRCRVAVYAKPFPAGAQREVGRIALDVGAGIGNWVARVPIKGLAPGRLRLSIMAALEAPLGGVGYREIPLVQVS
jgi:hypothetical protein